MFSVIASVAYVCVCIREKLVLSIAKIFHIQCENIVYDCDTKYKYQIGAYIQCTLNI